MRDSVYLPFPGDLPRELARGSRLIRRASSRKAFRRSHPFHPTVTRYFYPSCRERRSLHAEQNSSRRSVDRIADRTSGGWDRNSDDATRPRATVVTLSVASRERGGSVRETLPDVVHRVFFPPSHSPPSTRNRSSSTT